MDFGANISKRRLRNEFNTEFNDGYVYYNMDNSTILMTILWKRCDSYLHVILPNFINSIIINDLEQYCHENKLYTIVTSSNLDIEYYAKFGFQSGAYGKFVKHISSKSFKRDKSIPMTKQNYPVIASMMPLDLNVAKNQLF